MITPICLPINLIYAVLDEVHERGLESDFALALLMRVLKRRNASPTSTLPALRLVLMSATIQTDKFVTYLTTHARNRASGADNPPVSVHHIPGYTFPVTEFYRDDFERDIRGGGGEGAQEDEGAGAGIAVAATRYGGWAKAGSIDYDLLVCMYPLSGLSHCA